MASFFQTFMLLKCDGESNCSLKYQGRVTTIHLMYPSLNIPCMTSGFISLVIAADKMPLLVIIST